MASDPKQAGAAAVAPGLLIAHYLKRLRLPTVLREYEKIARECARDGIDHIRYLLRLLELELLDRERRVTERRIRDARFPATKSLDTFDFTAIPSLNKMLVLELAGAPSWSAATMSLPWATAAPAKATSPWLSGLPLASAGSQPCSCRPTRSQTS